MTNIPKSVVVLVARLIFNFDARDNISGTAEERVAKLCVQVEYIKC